MQTKAKTVTEYIREVPSEQLDALTELREICLKSLSGFKENLEYGMPGYSRNNVTEVAWDIEKNMLTLYLYNEEALKKLKTEIKGYDTGRTWIRFKKLSDLNFPLISKLLQEVVQTKFEVSA